MTRLHGTEAIEHARKTGAELHTYNDPTEDARDDVSVDEAEEIVAVDPRLIWCEVEASDDQIRDLGTESAAAGDIHMAAIAARAIGEYYDTMALSEDQRAAVDAMSVEQARAECQRVIDDAAA